MESPNETKLTEQQSNDHSPSTPPTPMIPLIQSFSPARKNQTQAGNEVGSPTPTTLTTGKQDHRSEQPEGSPDQVNASPTAMATPIGGGINPHQQSPMGAVAVAPFRWIITTPEDYAADYGYDKGQSDSDSDSKYGGDEEQSDSNPNDSGDEQQSGSHSDDDDDHEDDEEEHSDSDTGDARGGREPGSDSGEADNEKQPGSDYGAGDDEDEEQWGSDSGDDGEEEEEKEEEAGEGDEDMDVDDEDTATPTGVSADEGNNSLSAPGSIKITHRNAECSDPGIPGLTSGSSEEDINGPTIRGPVTATPPGPENWEGENSNWGEVAEAASAHRSTRRGAVVTMEEPRPAPTTTSTTLDVGNAVSDQAQTGTPVGPEEATEENDCAVSSNVAFEEDAPASSQEDEDMKTDSDEDEVSRTSRLRVGAGEPDLSASHDEEEIETTGSESPLLPAEIPETPPRTTNSARETQESGITPTQDMEEAASESDPSASHGEESIELPGSESQMLPTEIPETPPPRGRFGVDVHDSDRGEGGGAAVSSPEIPESLFPRHHRSEVDGEDSQEPAAPPSQDIRR